jgi:hypothetical protein
VIIMTSERRELIADLSSVVDETLRALRSEIPTTARVDQWDRRDVAAYFLYWHEATGWGTASTSVGGPPWPIPSGPDPINAATLRLREEDILEDVLDELGRSQRRLLRAARLAADLEAPAFTRPDGTTVSIRQRLEAIVRHWRSHLEAHRAATSRTHHHAELEPILQAEFVKRTTEEWCTELRDVCMVERMNTIPDAALDPQLEFRGMFVEIPHPTTTGSIRVTNSPIKFSRTPAGASRPPPHPGGDTAEILAVLGYSNEHIAQLVVSGVVGQGA